MDKNFDYRPIHPERSLTRKVRWKFSAKPMVDKLPPMSFIGQFDKKDRKKPVPDIALMGCRTYAFNEKATELLAPILHRAGEIIPFEVEGDTWYLLNVLESLDQAFDPDRSMAEMTMSDGTLVEVFHYVFRPEHLSDSPLFKVPNDGHQNIFFADRKDTEQQRRSHFMQIVTDHGLTGLEFKKVFSG